MGDTAFSERTRSLIPRNKYLAVVALAALCLSVVELVDLFELPLEARIGGGASSGSLFSVGAVASFLDIGYAGLFILMTMESSALPIPSEVVLPLAGYLAFSGKMNLGLALVDATLAGLAGSLISYYLGLKLGRPVVYRIMGKVGVSPKRLDEGERWVDSKGAWSVFIGRFIPGVRSVISIPAGLLRMEMKPFVILTVVGSFVWSAALIYLGYSEGPLWQNALDSLSKSADQAAFVVVAGVSILYVAYYLGAFGRKG